MDNLPQFNIVDIVVLVILVLGAVRGIMKGLSGELAGLISAAVAVAVGGYFYRTAGEFLARSTRLSEESAFPVAFLLMVVGGYILMRVLRLFLRSIMEFSFKGPIERVGGALAGLARAAIVCAALLLLMGLWPNESLHKLFAEDSVAGRATLRHLGPVYEEISDKYPQLKIPRNESLDPTDPEPIPDYDDADNMRGQEEEP